MKSRENYNDKIYFEALKFYSLDFAFMVETLGLPLMLYISRAIEAPASIFFIQEGMRASSKSAVVKDIVTREVSCDAYKKLCANFGDCRVKFPSCKHVLRLMDSNEGARLLSLGVSKQKVAERYNVNLATVTNWSKRLL